MRLVYLFIFFFHVIKSETVRRELLYRHYTPISFFFFLSLFLSGCCKDSLLAINALCTLCGASSSSPPLRDTRRRWRGESVLCRAKKRSRRIPSNQFPPRCRAHVLYEKTQIPLLCGTPLLCVVLSVDHFIISNRIFENPHKRFVYFNLPETLFVVCSNFFNFFFSIYCSF